MAEPKPFGKWLDFDENGMPVPRYTKPMPVKQMQDIFATGLALPYEPVAIDGVVPPEEEKLRGLTVGEVLVYRQLMNATAHPKYISPEESVKAANFIVDRVMGKPKQTNEVTQVNLSYAELLQQWIKEEEDESNNRLALEARQREQWTVIEFDKDGKPLPPKNELPKSNNQSKEKMDEITEAQIIEQPIRGAAYDV